MFSRYIMMGLGSAAVQAAATSDTPSVPTEPLAVHNISRLPGIRFENIAVRSNGQILTTTTSPNASIWQLDPLSILPPIILHTVPNATSCTCIVEAEPEIFYVACGDVSLKDPTQVTPSSNNIWELHVRDVNVLPNGQITKVPLVRHIANLPEAALLNGIALSRPQGNHLLVADTFRGLIWNVDTCTGDVGVALNDTSTKGPSSIPAGVNGLKAFNNTMYFDDVGGSTLWKVPVGENGIVDAGIKPSLFASNVSSDDLIVDGDGTVYVAGPYDIITKVDTNGHAEVIVGVFNSTASPLMGPSALAFGRMESDRWSLYVTTNGGIYTPVPSQCGIWRLDLGVHVAARLQ